MAVASSSAFTAAKHDVFLSFRGEDTRRRFTSHLYTALERRKVVTYIDNKLVRGEQISCGLLKAIEESYLWIVIFSENYASSSWCLDELLHILECDRKKGRVIPVFYHVDPSCVRKQSGSYQKALADLAKRYGADKVAKWKYALTTAANISGWSTQDSRSESELVEKIVGDVIKKLKNMVPRVAFEGLVGVHKPIQQIESLLHIGSDAVRIIGIWGLAGIGKTTLARATFDKLVHQFEGHFFLENVREKWEKRREKCRNMFYSELLEETNAVSWSTYDKIRLSRKRVLVVLDDVNDQEQLEYFVGSHKYLVGSGSRIIVTSRDRQSFGNRVSAVYKVEGLEYDEAHQLFCLNAFKRSSLVPHSKDLLERVVRYAEGIPLALKVLAALFSSKREEQWGSLLDQQIASLNKKVQNILQISYDGLDENQQNIFLDIACFFKGCDRHHVQGILDGCGFFADIGIDDLVDKSLITIDYDNKLCMHDLIQQMGWEIVRLQSPKEPGKRSRLWMAQDIYHVLKYNSATAMIEGIFLNTSKIKKVDLSPHVFQNTYNLRLLKITGPFFTMDECRVNLPQGLHCLPDALRYLCWDAYPSKSLPSDFAPENLIELRMSHSQVERLWDGVQDLPELKIIDLSYSENLMEMPDLSQAPKLKSVSFIYCTSLSQVPSHDFQKLDKLVYPDMTSSEKLTVLPGDISSIYLENLDLCGCQKIKYIPRITVNIVYLNLYDAAIEELPASIGSFRNLRELTLNGCKSLKNIPCNIFQLESLRDLSLSGCSSLKKIPDVPRLLVDSELNEIRLKINLPVSMESLENKEIEELKVEDHKSLKISFGLGKSLYYLTLSGCSSLERIPDLPRTLRVLDLSQTTIKEVPSSIGHLSDLSYLYLSNCKRLHTLPTSVCNLQSLKWLDLHGCSNFENFPEILEPMKSLFYFSLSGTRIRELPSSIENLASIETLGLGFCSILKFIPTSFFKLRGLRKLDLSGTDMSEIPNDLLYGLHSISHLHQSGKRVDIGAAKIKFSSLEWLSISHWKNLQYLPELPFNVDCLDALGCTSLETVSRSSAAILQGALHRDRGMPFFGDRMLFLNCLKLKQSARNNIIADAQLRILRMATVVLERRYACYRENASICYPGNEIPEWYNYQATGSSINIILPSDWLDSEFLGFSLCFVASFKKHNYSKLGLRFDCEIHLKTDTNERRKSRCRLYGSDFTMSEISKDTIADSDHVFMMYEYGSFKACKAVEGSITEVSFHFCSVNESGKSIDSSQLKRCGIRLLYCQEAKDCCLPLPDQWESKEKIINLKSEEIAKLSGSDIALDYDTE